MWAAWPSARGSPSYGGGARRWLRLALIAGEAGVGKTRLSTHLALHVHGEGASVLYGRCDEDLGVPYQPWAQALGHLVREAPQRVLEAHVEGFAGDLARLVPALRDRVPELPSPRESDPETERYILYAAVAGLLEEAGKQEPLLLILDDLHWADAPTLSLLRHVVTTRSSMAVMVVGTYRDSDLSRDHPLTALLADLHREQGVERVKLTGLDAEDVVALMEAVAGQEMDEIGRALAGEITRETAGNPFFAGELLRHLTESGRSCKQDDGRWRLIGDLADLGLPQSVREVIGRRVERLGPDARTALSAAAVIGRDFDVDLLLAVVDLPETRLLDLLDEGVAASLLQENRDRGGRFTSATRLWSTRCMRISAPPAAPDCTSGSQRHLRSSAGMSPASASVSSPATGPRQSSAPTPPGRSTTPGERQSAPYSSSPPMRRRAGIARRSSFTSRRPRAIAPSTATCWSAWGRPSAGSATRPIARRCSTPQRSPTSSTTQTGSAAPCSPTAAEVEPNRQGGLRARPVARGRRKSTSGRGSAAGAGALAARHGAPLRR